MSNLRSIHRWLVALAAVGALTLAGGIAYAAFPDSDVESYTGCLNAGGTAGGQLSQIAVGDEPLKPCGTNQRVVRLSGGDITKVTAGAGLTGGGDNGAVTLGLDAGHSLPQACEDGEIPKADGTGAWSCAADEDTRYVNGSGLDLVGTQFSVRFGYQLPQNCAGGQVPVRQGAGWACANQPSGPDAFADRVGFANVPQGSNPEVARLTLPGGAYLVSVSGSARDDGGGDDEVSVLCELWRNGTTFVTSGWADIGDEAQGGGPAGQLAMTTVVDASNQFANWTLTLHCESFTGSDHVRSLELSAVRVGEAHFQ